MTALELNNETAKKLRTELKVITDNKAQVRKVNSGYIVQLLEELEDEKINQIVSFLDANGFRNVCDIYSTCAEYKQEYNISFHSSFTVREFASC